MLNVRERKEREIRERERKRESVKRTRTRENGERHTFCFASFVCGRENEKKRGAGS